MRNWQQERQELSCRPRQCLKQKGAGDTSRAWEIEARSENKTTVRKIEEKKSWEKDIASHKKVKNQQQNWKNWSNFTLEQNSTFTRIDAHSQCARTQHTPTHTLIRLPAFKHEIATSSPVSVDNGLLAPDRISARALTANPEKGSACWLYLPAYRETWRKSRTLKLLRQLKGCQNLGDGKGDQEIER